MAGKSDSIRPRLEERKGETVERRIQPRRGGGEIRGTPERKNSNKEPNNRSARGGPKYEMSHYLAEDLGTEKKSKI